MLTRIAGGDVVDPVSGRAGRGDLWIRDEEIVEPPTGGEADRTFDASGSLPAWLQRVARNYAIDHYRRRRRERSMVVDGEESEELVAVARDATGSNDPHRTLEEKDLAGWLRRVIDRLPSELGQAVILRDLQGMSYEEMAVMLQIPLGTVKSRINRGRLELAKLLKRRRAEWSPTARERGGEA